MTISFNIDYRTSFGEEVFLNILSEDEPDEYTSHHMLTNDGHVWTCQVDSAGSIDYFYSVISRGEELRHEWKTVPHHLDTTYSSVKDCKVYDRWIDNPVDSYRYSSAFTECVASRPLGLCPVTDAKRIMCLKVRCPELSTDERLVMVGDVPSLGNWNPDDSHSMFERTHNEWTAIIDADRLERQRIEFKFVIMSSDGSVRCWEEGQNRYLILPVIDEDELVVFELTPPHMSLSPWRGAGTVIPVFSLRSEGSFGVGDFGDLKLMIDWCVLTGQNALQVLPINDTTINHTWTDSYPYNSISIYALHPQYADLRQLPQLNDTSRIRHYESIRAELNSLPQIDYERMILSKMDYLRELFQQEGASMLRSAEFKSFFSRNEGWLVPYAAFCHFRDLYGTATFLLWPDHHTFTEADRKRMSNHNTKIYKEVSFWYFIQFILDTQMRSAHEYARTKHVILKGDIPIGISRDGVEAWVEPRYFNLDAQTGAPPDAFSENGQNWGFPTYNWDALLADGCSWWIRRFRKMSEYFDAYRIDHVLGFFRIWEIPIDAVHGLLGHFSPSLGLTRQEIEAYGLHFHEDRFLRPFITDWTLSRIFDEQAEQIKTQFLDRLDDERYQMKPDFNTQRKVEKWWKDEVSATDDENLRNELASLRDRLYSLISDVLFLRDHRNPELFHPRIRVQYDFIYESLNECDKQAFNLLYDDYFFRRNNQFWYDEAMKKLPRLSEATRMLVCAEDLGMIPECVPWVMNQLRILSLEIQSMSKDANLRFGCLQHNPHLSVCTISTHDMCTLRQWWDEDEERSQAYYSSVIGHSGSAPHPLTNALAEEIIDRHLQCPSMLCLLSLQDWLSLDEVLQLPDPNGERINIPVNPRHYWRYRMHITIERLLDSSSFNHRISSLIIKSGR